MGKSTISMAIFHCYVSSPEGKCRYVCHNSSRYSYEHTVLSCPIYEASSWTNLEVSYNGTPSYHPSYQRKARLLGSPIIMALSENPGVYHHGAGRTNPYVDEVTILKLGWSWEWTLNTYIYHHISPTNMAILIRKLMNRTSWDSGSFNPIVSGNHCSLSSCAILPPNVPKKTCFG